MSLFTFGHSTLEIVQALTMLKRHDIDVLVDARSHPTSKWPQWQILKIHRWAKANKLKYEWWPGLGGWSQRNIDKERIEYFDQFDVDLKPYTLGAFPRQRISKPSGHDGWTNMGFYDYQFFMAIPEFLRASDLLIETATTKNVAYMCSESIWWHCHRSMIADYLLWLGHDSLHIQGEKMHSEAAGDRIDRYHPFVRETWEGWSEL